MRKLAALATICVVLLCREASATPEEELAGRTSRSAHRDDNCIQGFGIDAETGDFPYAAFRMDSPLMKTGESHYLKLTTKSGQTIKASIPSPALRGEKYDKTIPRSDFDDSGDCLQPADISQVYLEAGGDDGWFTTGITTYFWTNIGEKKILTRDVPFNKWVDRNRGNAFAQELTLAPLINTIIDKPECGYGVPVCECKKSAETCVFFLEVDEIMTFTSYQRFGVGSEDGLAVRGRKGVAYNIDEETGEAGPHPHFSKRVCGKEKRNPSLCTEPQFVDGETYRMAIAVNGQIPGPTLIVHEDQTVVVHVHNNMTSDGISVHWHGMHQMGTPWMDGFAQVTQCQIGPASSYTYQYVAKPSGTFWYHSHSGAQRTDGFFGHLIVKEKSMTEIQDALSSHGIGSFKDVPELHTLSFLDWHDETSLEILARMNAGRAFFPGVRVGKVPGDSDDRRSGSVSNVNDAIGQLPFFSGLINGKGRHPDVPFSQTRLSVFTVEKDQSYRFRLIGAQGHYAYRFSIDGHKLTVVGTDGYWMKPEKNADFIIIHSGERYDFILDADQETKNYWIRAETLEINRGSSGPPYQSLGHVAEGILQYVEPGADIASPPPISSTEYEQIKNNSPPIVCSSSNQCSAVNCPFENYHPSYHITCTNVNEFELLLDTPPDEMPSAYPSSCPDNNCLHFVNFHNEGIGDSQTSSVNGRNFYLPPVPPLTQPDDFKKQANKCDLEADCNPSDLACQCTHVIDIPYDKTVQFVLTSISKAGQPHPIHLHGHSFHVVKVGYPSYNSKTGFLQEKPAPDCGQKKKGRVLVQNPDIGCYDSCASSNCTTEEGCNPLHCTRPGWKDGQSPPMTITNRTIRKDTVIVPAGGYVAINFKSDNPGYWGLHCHIEVHMLEGMTVLVNEAEKEQRKLKIPKAINKCGDFAPRSAFYL